MKDLKDQYSLKEITAMLEDVKQKLAQYSYGRQHGRAGESYADPYKEYARLSNNLKSRQARARKREHIKSNNKIYNEILNIHQDEDKYGIKPVDERRYRNTFKSYYIGAPNPRDYIKRMTGLSLKQMYILQERTGLIPTPRITKAEADADWEKRWASGDIY
jgi:hypothetical protein